MKRLLHFFPTISRLGGVEAILKLHAQRDAEYGWESVVLIGCENEAKARQYGATGLGFRAWKNMTYLKKRFRDFYQDFKPDVFVCHNLWAGRHLFPYTPDCLKLAMMHTASKESRTAVANCANYLDGALAVSPQIARDVDELTGNRFETAVVDIPINAPPPPQHSEIQGRPFVVGYCGRLIIEQKRCDRLADLIDATLKMSPQIEFELMGDGSYDIQLRKRFGDNDRVKLLGRKSGADYWSRMQSWDAIVFTSDYEGTPIGLLEALSQGVIPLFPRINSGGDPYAEQVDPSLVYEKENLGQAAARLVALSQSENAEIDMMRARAIKLARRHSAEDYFKLFFGALEKLAPLAEKTVPAQDKIPRLSTADFLPLYFIGRLIPDWIY